MQLMQDTVWMLLQFNAVQCKRCRLMQVNAVCCRVQKLMQGLQKLMQALQFNAGGCDYTPRSPTVQ